MNTTITNTSEDCSKPVAVATVLQVKAPTSSKPGDRAFVNENGVLHGWVGGGCVQPAVQKISKRVLLSGQPTMLRVAPDGEWQSVDDLIDYSSNCLGRGSLLLFVEPLHTQPTLCVFGDSPVAISLAAQAVNLKLNVILQTLNSEKIDIPEQVSLRHQFEEVSTDYIVIATQGNGDRKAIETALECRGAHIGMVVSGRKFEALKQKLLDEGFNPSELDRVNGQAGLRIGAQLPEEIALSVLAEIVQLRRSTGKTRVVDGDAITAAKIENLNRNSVNKSKADGGCCGD